MEQDLAGYIDKTPAIGMPHPTIQVFLFI